MMLPALAFAQGIERVANMPTDSATFAMQQQFQNQMGTLRSQNALLDAQVQSLRSQMVAIQQLLGASPSTVVTTTTIGTTVSGTQTVTSLTQVISQTITTMIYPRCGANEVLTSDGAQQTCLRVVMPITACGTNQVLSWNGTTLSCRDLPASSSVTHYVENPYTPPPPAQPGAWIPSASDGWGN